MRETCATTRRARRAADRGPGRPRRRWLRDRTPHQRDKGCQRPGHINPPYSRQHADTTIDHIRYELGAPKSVRAEVDPTYDPKKHALVYPPTNPEATAASFMKWIARLVTFFASGWAPKTTAFPAAIIEIPLLMIVAAGFGILHIVFGLIIWRKHGG